MVIVDGFVEIIRRKDDNTFLINGEEHYFEVVFDGLQIGGATG
jgi:hypothetical protein